MRKIFDYFNSNKRGDEEARWDKTRLVEERIEGSGFYEEKGILRKEKKFKGREIIGRDKKINKGVYLGAGAREAIVVDGDKDPALDKIFEELLEMRSKAQEKGKSFKEGVLIDVWSLVKTVIPFNVTKADEIESNLEEPDTKIYLSAYIGGGVCRHQALLTGYLLERLCEQRLIGGRVSIDRNYVPGKGGHAWVRYKNSIGEIYILDSARNYIGKLSDVSESSGRWFYERPEDTSKYKKILANIRRAFDPLP